MLSKAFKYGFWGTFVSGGTLFALDSVQNNGVNSNGVVRFGRATVNAAVIAVDYKWNFFVMKETDSDYEQRLSNIHLRSAQRLKKLFCQNGGAFIKVGQYIGSLDYLLPQEYVKTMKSLHDSAPESPVSELYETVETDLKCKIGDIFKEIDSKPIGTASLAQCHRAVLHDGTVVAVKIQHPKVKKNSHADIKTMKFLVNCCARVFPEFKFVWLAEATEKNLPIELDFKNEAQNIQRVTEILQKFKFVKVPKVFLDYSSDRVLTMEYCEGFRIDNIDKIKEKKIDVSKISKRLGMIFSELIYSHGFVHTDPHPGNVLINPVTDKKGENEFKVVLLDHGLYQNLTAKFRYDYANIWMAILQKDLKRIEELTANFNVKEYFALFACIITGRSWDAISNGIAQNGFSENEGNEIKSEASKYLREIAAVLNQIPSDMLLLLKTNDLLRGLETSLGTRASASSFVHMTKCCVKMINSYERDMLASQYMATKNKTSENNKVTYFEYARFCALSRTRELFDLFKIYTFQLVAMCFEMFGLQFSL